MNAFRRRLRSDRGTRKLVQFQSAMSAHTL